MKPSESQIREFWEWCGFEQVSRFGGSLSQATEYLWLYPEGTHFEDLPPIDLNNLSRYAIPKLKGRTRIHFSFNPLSVSVFEEVGSGGSPIYYEHRYDNQEDPALALFWAINEAMHER